MTYSDNTNSECSLRMNEFCLGIVYLDTRTDTHSLTYSDETGSDCSSLCMDRLDTATDIHSLDYSTDSDCSSPLHMDRFDPAVYDNIATDNSHSLTYFDETDPDCSLRMGKFSPADADSDSIKEGSLPTGDDEGNEDKTGNNVSVFDTAAGGTREVSRVGVEVAAAVTVVPPIVVEAPVLRRSKRLEATRKRRRSSNNSRAHRCVSTRATRASVKAGKAKLYPSSLA